MVGRNPTSSLVVLIMTTWPASLPQSLLIEGYQETLPATVLRTEMDAGPAEQRRRFTAAVTPIGGLIDLTKTELSSLYEFFRTETKDGALPFGWTHPVTGAAVSMRFTAAPQIAAVHDHAFRVSLALEILP